MTAKGTWAGGRRVLLEEACRASDRLEKLDHLLSGDTETWARVFPGRGDDPELVLRIDGALAESRQQANALRLLVATLETPAAANGAQSPVKAGEEKPAPTTGGFFDELARRRSGGG